LDGVGGAIFEQFLALVAEREAVAREAAVGLPIIEETALDAEAGLLEALLGLGGSGVRGGHEQPAQQ